MASDSNKGRRRRKLKTLNVQIQPARSPGLDSAAIVAALRTLSKDSWVNEGEDGGPYINVCFDVPKLERLWLAIRGILDANPAVAQATIITCQGKRGWDDYLLLHHFDVSEQLDDISN